MVIREILATKLLHPFKHFKRTFSVEKNEKHQAFDKHKIIGHSFKQLTEGFNYIMRLFY